MRWSVRRAVRVLVTVVLATSGLSATVQADEAPHVGQPSFGPNVLVFDPTMPTSQIQATVDSIFAQQVDNEFGAQRFALLFKPGTYGTPSTPLNIHVGYYTSIAGLGASPDDVTINGTVNVLNRCLPSGDCNALDNFWRSLDNLHVVVQGQFADFWATSQATPLRRLHMTGQLFLFDFGFVPAPKGFTQSGFSSGGFLADSLNDGGATINGSQQQYIARNSKVQQWTNGVWNQVFAGVIGAPAQSFGAVPQDLGGPPPFTTLPTAPITREKPFLQVDSAGDFSVLVPAVQHDTAGTTWASGATSGTAVPIERFFIATPADSVKRINAALDDGKNLLLTPGVYHLPEPIRIHHHDTLVLGLGYPTLVPDDGDAAMTVDHASGVDIAGVMFDAGPLNSPVLLQVGAGGDDRGRDGEDESSTPSALQDVFFRIGGATPGRATDALIVNSNNVILDDIWSWRADHGNGVGWTANTADTGLVVNGDDVTAYGLFVEHYQKFNVIWNGDNGRTIMWQNELPYDPPDQAAYAHDGILGWAGFKVADSVQNFEGWGLGGYCFFHVNPSIHASHMFEVPIHPGVRLHDILTVSLGGVGTIDHVVNDFGAPVPAAKNAPSDVVLYPPA